MDAKLAKNTICFINDAIVTVEMRQIDN